MLIVMAAACVFAASNTETELRIDGQAAVITGGSVERALISFPELDGQAPEVTVAPVEDGWQRVHVAWDLAREVQQDELAIAFQLLFTPDFWWAPHLAPEDGYCIAQHVFRSPAVIAAQHGQTLAIVPDLSLCGRDADAPWFLDVDAPARSISLGMSRTGIPEHVLYRKTGGMTLGPGRVELAFFAQAYRDRSSVPNPWGRVAPFLWQRYGRPLLEAGEPVAQPLDRYVDHTYNWAFDTWAGAVWQEFEIDGVRAGAPAFIVNITESPNHPGPADLREFLSVWNQTWFSSLRSASGILRYARRTGNADLERRAMLTKELALAAPMNDGLFPSVYRTEMERVEVDGTGVARSKGWDTGYWTNSNRCPWEHGVMDSWYHIADSSWTTLVMLEWYDQLDRDPRLLDYARAYADKLVTMADARGFFPAWVNPETLAPAQVLWDSPETSVSATLLLELARLTDEPLYRVAGLKALDAVLVEIVPAGRWEDYETYWSCCPWGKEEQLGRKVRRSGMYKQNTMSMFWTAQACLAAYRATDDARYLHWGRRTMDELSMFQQVWQPPFIYVPALGGFGVMNCDGEWNDARQSLFAELFMDYYRVTGERDLFERGIAALKASFIMMYCPENPDVKAMWEKVYPWFGPEDYGFTMENYGHGGATSPEGEGMGVFTIFDWGNGAASQARNSVHDHYGDVYIDRARGETFGIDSVRVEKDGDGWRITDPAGAPRTVRVVYDDGTGKEVALDGSATVAP